LSSSWAKGQKAEPILPPNRRREEEKWVAPRGRKEPLLKKTGGTTTATQKGTPSTGTEKICGDEVGKKTIAGKRESLIRSDH